MRPTVVAHYLTTKKSWRHMPNVVRKGKVVKKMKSKKAAAKAAKKMGGKVKKSGRKYTA